MTASDDGFTESIAANYERWMVPLYFEPYAEHCTNVIRSWNPGSILEVGAGTGVLTRHLAAALPQAKILATDLNPAMIGVGRSIASHGADVRWEVADVAALPCPTASVDVVVAQFAVMFFPDRVAGLAEMRRVLAPGGRMLFTTWGPIEGIPVDLIAEATLAELYPKDPPSFMRRVPHGYHRPERIREDLIAAGFETFTVDPLDLSAAVGDVRDLAMALCTGTPNRTEIQARDPQGLAAAVDRVTEALSSRFGPGPMINEMSALIITAQT